MYTEAQRERRRGFAKRTSAALAVILAILVVVLPALYSAFLAPAPVSIDGSFDDWFDWETNCFHFMGGAPQDRAFSAYEPHTMTWHLPRYLEAHRPAAAPSE